MSCGVTAKLFLLIEENYKTSRCNIFFSTIYPCSFLPRIGKYCFLTFVPSINLVCANAHCDAQRAAVCVCICDVKADALSTCAKFLNITLVNSESERLFSNNPSLAKRIVFEIEALYPIICADCDSEYSISFTPSLAPALRCFLCLQGCHDFISPSTVHPTCKGAVWLCKPYHDSNNPFQTKKSKSKTGSKEPSRKTSGSGVMTPMPSEDQKVVQFSADELNTKLENMLHQQD